MTAPSNKVVELNIDEASAGPDITLTDAERAELESNPMSHFVEELEKHYAAVDQKARQQRPPAKITWM